MRACFAFSRRNMIARERDIGVVWPDFGPLQALSIRNATVRTLEYRYEPEVCTECQNSRTSFQRQAKIDTFNF